MSFSLFLSIVPFPSILCNYIVTNNVILNFYSLMIMSWIILIKTMGKTTSALSNKQLSGPLQSTQLPVPTAITMPPQVWSQQAEQQA